MEFDYYDAVLVGIAASMLAGIALGVLTPVSTEAGIVVGTAAATVFVYAGAFRNPPTSTARTTARVGALAWHVVAVLLIGSQYV